MKEPAGIRWNYEVRLLAWLAAAVSLFSFLLFFRHGDVLLYGDAVAHINIARRVFDSKTPGLLQLGTVWLPLPHLLMIPFLLSQKMWQVGSGGSIPSLAAYILGVIGIFRLVRSTLSPEGQPTAAARIAAWIAALVYAANPNLIYMQSTAMGEALYLAFFIWAVVYFGEFAHGERRALVKCGVCLAAACLTRYDGWFLAVVMGAVALVIGIFPRKLLPIRAARSGPAPLRNTLIKFVLIVAAAPALWFAYNGFVYQNPLEFENGPYSAKAIEKKTQSPGSPGHPGAGNLYLSGQYFLKAAEFNVAENQALQRLWLLLPVAALVIGIAPFFANRVRSQTNASPGPRQSTQSGSPRALWPLLFLSVPVPFYALSVAYGGVPIFIPAWWPFSHYNVRYGLQLLPALAAGAGIVVYFGWKSDSWHGLLRRVVLLFVAALVVASDITVWQAGPVCLREAQLNMHSRNTLEARMAVWLQAMPPNSTLLMYLGDHVGAVQRAGIPLSHVINEGNHRVWKQPTDTEGLWERALADPAAHADYVLAFQGDPVWQAVHDRHLPELVEVEVTGQARAILYRTR
jgi:hypothetical protein